MKRTINRSGIPAQPIVIITATSVTVAITDCYQRWVATVEVPRFESEMELAA